MKAIMKKTAAPGADYVDIDVPEVGPRDVLIKVKAAAICGTDIHIHDWTKYAQDRVKPPMIFGHEVCGKVEEIGAEVRGFAKGDLVAVETHIPCEQCYQCQTGNQHICERMAIVGVHASGAFAEYACIPAVCCWKLDPGTDPDLGAILEPIGVAVHGAMVDQINGKSVAVFGCGPIGLFGIGTAAAMGATKVFALEPNRKRLEMARQFAPDAVLIDPVHEDAVQIIRDATGGRGADVALEISGSTAATKMAFQVIRLRGRVSLIGLPSEPTALNTTADIIYKEATVYGTTGRLMWDTWWRMRSLLDSGRFDPMPAITHRLPLADLGKGIQLAKSGEAGKVLLYP